MALRKPETKAEFFKLEDKTWRELNAQMKGLSREAWLEHGAAGAWTAKDVWAHIADWMTETRRRLPMMLRNGKLEPISIAKFNQAHYKRNRKIPLAVARKRVERERKKLLALLKTLASENLLDNKRIYSWASYSTFNHYNEHIPPLGKFRLSASKQRR